MNHFTITAGALRRRKVRTVFTSLSVLVVFILFGLAMALRHGFKTGADVIGADLVLVTPTGRSGTSLPVGLASQVAGIDGIRRVLPFSVVPAHYQDPRNQLAISGVPTQGFIAVIGGNKVVSEADARRWRKERTGVLVRDTAMKKYGWHVGQQLILTPPEPIARAAGAKQIAVQIAGVVNTKKKGFRIGGPLLAHLKYLNAWRHQDTAVAMLVQVRDATHADTVADAVRQRFANSTTPVKARSFHALLQGVFQRVGNVGALTMAVIAAALLSLLFVTGNAMTQSVAERRAEFAVLSALGFNRSRLGALIIGETLLLMAPPALIGLGLTGWLVSVMARGAVALPGFEMGVVAYLAGIGVAAGLIIVSSLVPLASILRMRDANALRASQ